jgi:hypothetical protein
MTQWTSSTLNQASVADSSILRYTNFPLLDSSTLVAINSGKFKDGLDGLYFLFRGAWWLIKECTNAFFHPSSHSFMTRGRLQGYQSWRNTLRGKIRTLY